MWPWRAAGAVASASSTYGPGFAASGVINGDRAGANWGNGGGWNDATPGQLPGLGGGGLRGQLQHQPGECSSVQDTYWAPSEPTSTQTFTAYGLRSFDVQYWTGTAWATVPGGSVTGNTLVWRTVTFPAVTTQKIRVMITGAVDGYSRLTEIEAYTDGPVTLPGRRWARTWRWRRRARWRARRRRMGRALRPSGVINGDRAGVNWGNGGGWNDADAGAASRTGWRWTSRPATASTR